MAIASDNRGIGSSSSRPSSGATKPKPLEAPNVQMKDKLAQGLLSGQYATKPKNTDTYVPTSSGGGESYSGGGGGGSSYEDGVLNRIIDLLNQQKEQMNKYFDTAYNQRINEITAESDSNRDLINKRYKQGERYLNNMYGRTDSGTNWTNRVRNNQNWQSMLAQNRQNTAGLKDSAMASRDLGKSQALGTLASGWYNYILPVMTNRQNFNDSLAQELDYRRYLANL